MSTTPTAPVAGKNAAGEDVVIEIPIPTANSAAAWNEAMQTTAEKAGVTIEGVTKPAAAATTTETTTKTKTDDPTLFRATLTVNGKEIEFKDADPATVLKQYTAAVEASQLAAPAAAATTQTVDEKKPALSAADMFDVGTKLIAGDASGLDTLLEKSGALDRWLESKGLNVDKLKAATEKTQTDTVHDAWKTATDAFTEKVKAGEIDFPGGQQNMKMMGITLAQLGLKPSVESMIKSWEHMKKEGLVFPVEKTQQQNTQQTTQQTTTAGTKTATSSTAIGVSGAGKETVTTQQQQNVVPLANRRFELDLTKLSQSDASRAWNELIDQGVKPEQINVIQ